MKRAAFRRDEDYSWESDFDSEAQAVEPVRPKIDIEQFDFGTEPFDRAALPERPALSGSPLPESTLLTGTATAPERTALPVPPDAYAPASRSYEAVYWALAIVSALGVVWVLVRDLSWPGGEPSPATQASAATSADRDTPANGEPQTTFDPFAPAISIPVPQSLDTMPARPTIPAASLPGRSSEAPAAAKPAPPQGAPAVQRRTPAEEAQRPVEPPRRPAETQRPVEPPLSQRYLGAQRPGDTQRVPQAVEPQRTAETPRPAATTNGNRAGLAPPPPSTSVPAVPPPSRPSAAEGAPSPEAAPPPRAATADPVTRPVPSATASEPVNRPPPPPRETANASPVAPAPPVAATPPATTPPAATPPAATPAAATPPAASAAAAALEAERGAIRDALGRYRNAFNALDANAAHQVWPTVNQRTLDRAFGQLREQDVWFEACSIDVNGVLAQANCSGVARFVPKVGKGSQQVESRQWNFSLRKNGSSGWLIQEVQAR